MNPKIEAYIAQSTRALPPAQRADIQSELRADLHQLVDDLRLAGHSQEEATEQALNLFGQPQQLALALFQVHTLPKFRFAGQIVFAAVCAISLMYSMRIASSVASPSLQKAYGCETRQPNVVCLPDRDGWIALSDIQQGLTLAGWKRPTIQQTARDVQGVTNDIVRLNTPAGPLDVPVGPDRIWQARMQTSGIPFSSDPNFLESSGEHYIRASALFEILATQNNRPRIQQHGGTSSINIGNLRFDFPYQSSDPADNLLWSEVGRALSVQHHLTVAAQSKAVGTQYPLHLKVNGAGTYVIVFRHPGGYGVGYVLAKASSLDMLSTQLPIQANMITSKVRRAWWHPQTICVIRLDDRLALDQVLAPHEVQMAWPES